MEFASIIKPDLEELAVKLAALPPVHVVHSAVQQLKWLEDIPKNASGKRPQLQQLFSHLNDRLLQVENVVQDHGNRVSRFEAILADAARGDSPSAQTASPEVEVNECTHESFSDMLHQRFHDIRCQLDSKTDQKDHTRLADALSQSCRDLTATLRASRQDLAVLERNGNELSSIVAQNSKDLARLDTSCTELQEAYDLREQDLADLEKKWSHRLWGYRENSPSEPRRPRSQSGNTTSRSDVPPWRPWGITPQKTQAMAHQAADLRSPEPPPPRRSTLRPRLLHHEHEGKT